MVDAGVLKMLRLFAAPLPLSAFMVPVRLPHCDWREKSAEEIKADLMTLLNAAGGSSPTLDKARGFSVMVDGVPLRDDIMRSLIASGGGTITFDQGVSATVTCVSSTP